MGGARPLWGPVGPGPVVALVPVAPLTLVRVTDSSPSQWPGLDSPVAQAGTADSDEGDADSD